MKKSRLIAGVIVFCFIGFYYYSTRLIQLDIINIINTSYGGNLGSTFVPVVLVIIAISLIASSIQSRRPKRDYSNELGKQCPACGQIISKLASKCPFCGKVQPYR